jgi:hypothetical protein
LLLALYFPPSVLGFGFRLHTLFGDATQLAAVQNDIFAFLALGGLLNRALARREMSAG